MGNSKSVIVPIRFDPDRLARVDAKRGDVPRSRFIRAAVDAFVAPPPRLESVPDPRAPHGVRLVGGLSELEGDAGAG